MATDGILSYAIFTYQCGGLNWLSGSYASVGFGVTQNFFANHVLSLTPNVNDIACAGTVSEWSNVVYQVSVQLQDICVDANPCMNGGICILNVPPDNYTCNCIGNYTGDTCGGIRYLHCIVLVSKAFHFRV